MYGSGETPLAFGPEAERLNEQLDRLRQTVEALGDRLQRRAAEGADKAAKSFQELARVAGKVLAANLATAANTFGSLFSQLASGFGAANNQLVQLAANANPAAAVQLNIAFKSLTYTLGQILQPVIRGATLFLRFLADTLYNLSPGTKALIAAVAAFTVTLAALVPVLATVVALFGVIDVELAGIPILIGALVAAFAAVAVGAGTLAAAGGKFGAIVDALAPVKELVGELIDLFDELVSAGLDAFADILRSVAPLVRVFAATVRQIIHDLGPLFPMLVKIVAVLGAAGLFAALAALLAPMVALAAPALALAAAVAGIAKALVSVADAAFGAGEGIKRLIPIMTALAGVMIGRSLGLPGMIAGGYMGKKAGEALVESLGEGQKKEKKAAPFGPVDVRATTAEEFQRSLTRSALTASFGQGAQAGPEEETAENTRTAAEILQEIRDTLAEKLGGVGDYLRRVGGRA